MTTSDANPGAGFPIDAQTRADVTTAALAVLVDALRRLGTSDSAALACLRDAPEKIEAAVARGRGALVLYRVNSTDPRGIVTDDAARLSAFAEAAAKDGAEVLGLNTWQNIMGAALDRIFDLAFSPAWDALFANLEDYFVLGGSASGAGASGNGGLLGGLFSGVGNWVGSILGLDTGGDVTVSGKAGIDRNMTILRTSDNERVSVRRQGDAMGRPVTVNIYAQDLRSFQGSQAQIAGQMRRALAAADRAA